jgi:hypothetical protein
MCLHVVLSERDTVLHFCNRYVGIGSAGDMGYGPPEVALGVSTDVGNALSLLDSVQFATLHVKSVSVDIQAERGLAEAMILSAHAPRKVRPGQSVTARLKLQLYRQGVKTIQVRLRIPHDAHGSVPVTIFGPQAQLGGLGAGGAASLIAILTGSLGGPVSGPSGPPASLSQLRKQFAHIPPYDGLQARLGHGRVVHVYRDPKLLITGSDTLHFTVSGRHGSSQRRSSSSTGRQ